jgi:UDP-3-O-[3-hydroxymyristoyl] glucosamine N-acyltransferase LpxD
MGLTLAQDPRRAFVDGHNTLEQHGFYGPWLPTRIDPSAVIHPSAVIEPEGVVLGPDCRVDAKAVILRGTELGQAVHVMAGAVLGGEGFQSMKFSDAVVDFSHAGGLIVGDRTVIMANAVIARAVFRQATTIGPDCRIGNGAFVSHNCRIGARCLIGHNATVAGNCLVGDGVTIGPGATTIHCLTFGANAAVTAGAVVIRDVPEDTRVSGNFAQSHRQALRRISER